MAGSEYFDYVDYEDYCRRRFKDSEERLLCLAVSHSLDDEHSSNFCDKRIYSRTNQYFEYNLVYKYKCFQASYNSNDNMHADEIFTDKLFGCLNESTPLIYQ